MNKFRHVGRHAEDLSDGRPLAPGEFVELTDEEVRDLHNERLITEGILLAVDAGAEEEAKLATRRETAREKKEREEREAAEGGDQ